MNTPTNFQTIYPKRSNADLIHVVNEEVDSINKE